VKNRMRLGFVCLVSSFGVLLSAADVETNRKLIQGTWYCQTADNMYHRLEFKFDGAFMWLGFIPTENGQHKWSNSMEGGKYAFTAPTVVRAGGSDMLIASLTAASLNATWVGAPYRCTRTPPSGDTASTRAMVAVAEMKQRQAFIGRWVSSDRREYVEFLTDETCFRGHVEGSKWATTKDKWEVLHDGKDAMCGGAGIYSRERNGALTFTYGMADTPVTFRRSAAGR